ncbi:MAG: tryptophan 7-halogenase [Chthoniobacteraceae bacterium]
MSKRINTVGIIGSGPSGGTLASLLRMRGVEVTIFDDGRRPDLVVGESLIPSIIPILRKLGIEDRAAAICQYKPGVSFTFGVGEEIDFCFQSVAACAMPTYAYNAPRPEFDRLFDVRADELGAKRVSVRAKVERAGADGLRLAGETLEQAPWLNGRQPDLLVDSTGRSRLFARTMEIPAEMGPRKDVAYFAHYHGFIERPPLGQVIIGRLASGWSWRIPLPGRLSVGVVMNKKDAAQLGDTPEARLEAAIDRDPVLAAAGVNRARLSDVATYTNYQLVSERGFGPGWVMTGDALGFVDPMLSPGMWLALRSAELLTEKLDDLPAYSREMRKLFKAWMQLVQYFYDGRMFAMYHTGMSFEKKYPGRISEALHNYFDRTIACMASGATTTSRVGNGMLAFMGRHGIFGADPAELAIR